MLKIIHEFLISLQSSIEGSIKPTKETVGLSGKSSASSDNGGTRSQGKDSRDSNTSNIEINLTRAAASITRAFIAGVVGARDIDAPISPGPEAWTVDSARANFLIFLTGFAKASSISEGRFEPDLAFDTVPFVGPAFFFVATLALFPAVLLWTWSICYKINMV
jgi:hypothetical protein